MGPGTNESISRRNFINLTAGGIAAATLIATPLLSFASQKTQIKAVVFDAFPIFDARPVFQLADSLFPDKGMAFSNSWRIAQFEYTWLRTSAGQYKNFWNVTEDALIFAAKKSGVNLAIKDRHQLMEAYLHLDVWPDVLPALQLLKGMGIRLSILSNWTVEMQASCVKNAKLEGYFENLLSTDKVQAFKPSINAYQMGVNSFKLNKEEIVFAAHAGWDAVGAKWFGYPTFWVNRQNVPLEELSVTPDGTGKDLAGLVDFIKSARPS
jgi:2-haloacid dehalogenase